MDKLDFKKKVLEGAKLRQQEIIDDYKTRIGDMKKGEMNINEDQLDMGQKSFNSESNDMINVLANELNFLVDEMNLLNKIQVDGNLHDSVALGSVVITDKKTFFPSVSIETFGVDGQEFFGISDKAPLYSEMKGKKAGETFSYKGNQYKIEDVY